MHKTPLQISLHETSMVCGRSFDAYSILFLVAIYTAFVIVLSYKPVQISFFSYIFFYLPLFLINHNAICYLAIILFT